MAKKTFKLTNWATYNKALIHRGSLTFWLDESAIQAWYDKPNTSSPGRPQRYSELAISTVMMLKRVFRLTLRAAQGFIDSIFTLMKLPLRCPDYSCVSRRARSVNIPFKTPSRGEIAHLVIHLLDEISTLTSSIGGGTAKEWAMRPGHRYDCWFTEKVETAMKAITRNIDRSIWQDADAEIWNDFADGRAIP